MSASELLRRLQETPEGEVFDWKRIRIDIHDAHERATSEAERVILLGIFHTTMDAVERNAGFTLEELHTFKEARLKDYHLLLVREALVGENVCTETLHYITEREITDGRMSASDTLREAANKGIAEPHISRAELVLIACVSQARKVLASQMLLVAAGNHDFMPRFKETAIHLYLVGVMQRYGEQFDLPTPSRDLGFLCLMSLLIEDGMIEKKARDYIPELHKISVDEKGDDSGILIAGYHAVEGDGSLVRIFDIFRNDPAASGGPYRLIDRSKPVAPILAFAGFFIALMLDRTFGESLGIGTVVGISMLAIALVTYRQMIKQKN